ncbi:MAG: UvrB/UvrC motif-containing protein [Candidatus Omnitrophica bacterium]|nr:UvrB/UvrC motif-containing protein [Candidatus Omnitrophota bacterium]
MLCDLCHKNIATVHLTEIVENKIVEMHICQACAKSKAKGIEEQISIFDFLAGLTNIEEVTSKKSKLLTECKACGLTYADFKKNGRFGCASCYQYFKNAILPLLRKIHGSDQHKGKCPREEKVEQIELKIKDLRKRLELAIQLEEYEEAAKLRDEIKKIEEQKGKNV